MLLKALISKVNVEKNAAEVTLPEFNNVVTAEIPFYKRTATYTNISHTLTEPAIGDFVILMLFNDGSDYNDGVIL